MVSGKISKVLVKGLQVNSLLWTGRRSIKTNSVDSFPYILLHFVQAPQQLCILCIIHLVRDFLKKVSFKSLSSSISSSCLVSPPYNSALPLALLLSSFLRNRLSIPVQIYPPLSARFSISVQKIRCFLIL